MRASEAPEQWKLVLDAINHDNYELAHKLAVKYNFASVDEEDVTVAVRHSPLKGDYVAQSPDGKMHCHESGNALSIYLGLAHSYVGVSIPRLEKRGGVVQKGMMKGWKFWREK